MIKKYQLCILKQLHKIKENFNKYSKRSKNWLKLNKIAIIDLPVNLLDLEHLEAIWCITQMCDAL